MADKIPLTEGDSLLKSESDLPDSQYIAKAYNGVQFIVEDLELFSRHTFISRKMICSLSEDLKMIGHFLKCVQGTSTDVLPEAILLAMNTVLALPNLLRAVDTGISDMCFDHQRLLMVQMDIFGADHGKIGDLAKRSKRLLEKYESAYSSEESSSRIDRNPIAEEKIFIGFEDEARQLRDKLTLGQKQLQVISIVGMPGIGSFPEDFEIPARRLYQSWIAEGFIQGTDGKRLEDVAEDYLMDLVNRSLVIVATERSDGGIKSCNIHDMLRDLCLRKAKERKFVLPICMCGPNATTYDDKSRLLMYQGRYPHFSHCQYFHSYNSHYVSENIVFTGSTLAVYKFLKTLELRHIILDKFPGQILHLLHLRYLALQLECLKVLPQSMFQFWKLETCILDGEKGGRVTLPCDIFKMAKLRHLKISQELHPEDLKKCSTGGQLGNCFLCFPDGLSQQQETSATVMPEDSSFPSSSSSSVLEKDSKLKETLNSILENLQSLSQLCPAGFGNELLARTPNLRKLGLHLTLSEGKDKFAFPDLSQLNQLEALKFEYQTFGMVPFSFPHPNMFPPSLRKLSLIGSHVDWKEMALMELLPNLEVLKIKDNFFNGPQWETTDHGFPCLKFLKLSHVDLLEWISSSSHFPSLEKLVLNGCLKLKEIPSEIGDIPTLETIEVYKSSPSTVESAREIQESNIGMGNNDLKVFIFHHFQEY